MQTHTYYSPGAFATKMGSLRAPRTSGRSRADFLDSYEEPHGRSGRVGVLKTATLDNRRLSPSYAAHGRNGSVTEQDLAVTTAQDPRKAALYVFGEKSQLRVSGEAIDQFQLIFSSTGLQMKIKTTSLVCKD